MAQRQRGAPPFDPSVEISPIRRTDDEATVVILTGVPSVGDRPVALDGGSREVLRAHTRHIGPIGDSRLGVSGLMNADAETPALRTDSDNVEEGKRR